MCQPIPLGDILGCERCSENHSGLTAYPLPENPWNHTHFSLCPSSGEPIMLTAHESLEEEFASINGE